MCTQCISFFLLPLYTAILSKEEYGAYDLIVSYATLLLPLVNWQFDQGLFRFMLDCRSDHEQQRTLFSTLFFSSCLQAVLYALLFALVHPLLQMEHAYFLLIYVILQVFVALLLQFVRGQGSNVKYTIASFISASSTTVLNVVMLVILKMGLRGLFYATILGQLLSIVYLIFASRCWSYISLHSVDRKVFKAVGSYAFPLIPNNLAWWVVNASDKTVISYFLGVAENGIFTVANKFPHVFIVFYNILNLSWTETVSLHYMDEDRDEFLTDTMTSLFKLFSCACFGIIALMPFIFPIMVNANYSAAYNQILILMFAMLFRVLVGLYSCVYVAQKQAKKIATSSMASAVINIVIDLLLIKRIHLYAASISSLVAFLSMFLIRYADINKTVHMRIRRPVIIGTVCIGILLIATYYCQNKWIQLVALLITVIYSVVMNLDMLKSLQGIFRKKLLGK
jgi:O-antigen/teichoic acid export membrane protein